MTAVLFIDLDGTLLDSKLRIPAENALALQEAISTGAEIVFSTARPLASAKRLAAQFPGIRYLISSNGGCLADLKTGSAECVASFSQSEVVAVLEFGAQRGLRPILYTVDRIFADSVSAEVYLEISRSGAQPEIVETLPTDGVVKVLFVGHPTVVKSSLDVIGQHTKLASAVFAYVSYPEYLEMSPKIAGKATAGNILLNKLGLNWNDAISFGDSANDVAIMRCSAQAVAVANATSEVKAVATLIAPSNDEGGVAVALRWILFSDLGARNKIQICERVSPVNSWSSPWA